MAVSCCGGVRESASKADGSDARRKWLVTSCVSPAMLVGWTTAAHLRLVFIREYGEYALAERHQLHRQCRKRYMNSHQHNKVC